MLRARPSFHAYGNEIVGGAAGARREFPGSNLDWGQDLHRLRSWYDAHPEVRPLAFTYYGMTDPSRIGLNLRPLPAALLRHDATPADGLADERPEPFYWAISASVPNGFPGPIAVGDDLPVNAVIRSDKLDWDRAAFSFGNSIFVFKVTVTGGEAVPSIPFEDLRGCMVPVDGRQRIISP